MGTQKNRLNETVLLSTQNMLELTGKNNFTLKCFVYLNQDNVNEQRDGFSTTRDKGNYHSSRE